MHNLYTQPVIYHNKPYASLFAKPHSLLFFCFFFRVLKDLKLSISPARSQQSLTLDCSSRVVWIEQATRSSASLSSRSASSPPTKRRKIEEPFHDLLQGLLEEEEDRKKSSDGQMLSPERKLGVVLSTALPMLQSCERACQQSVVIIATWRKEKTGEESDMCSCFEEASEIGVASLSFQLLCSGELNLNDSCLSLWDGE